MQGSDIVRSQKKANFIKILIIICMIALAFLTWMLDGAIPWWFVLPIIGVLLVVWISIEHRNYSERKKRRVVYQNSTITCFALISQEGGREKEWFVSGAVSFLIGRSTADTEVDIELGDTHYSSYVSDEHAVINLIAGSWYVEDMDSGNGVGLRRKHDECVYRLKPGQQYEIDIGDVIYISKAKILVI